MKTGPIKAHFARGIHFLRDHQQLWLTAFVGLLIICSFLFVAWRFTMIAQRAQEELVQTRVTSILDAFVLLAPEAINNQDKIRRYLKVIKAENPTIDSFTIFAEHGTSAWRVYVSVNGPREGTVVEDFSVVLDFALADPSKAFIFESQTASGREFTTARAITNAVGDPVAVAVTQQGLAEIDTILTKNIQTSLSILFVLLFVIAILFLRHARIVDFATLYRKQLEVDEMKDNFISMASHELKTPLSIIRGYVEFLKHEQQEEERQKYLTRIDISAQNLRHLVDDILDVSRIETGQLQFTPEEIRPFEILEEIYEMFKHQAEQKGVRFTLHGDDTYTKEVVVQADKERLKQALVNIVSNALKYTFHGEVSITQNHKEGVVEIVVEDTGVGMHPHHQKHLFEKFYRVQEEETKDVSGTGLGLWITKHLIEYMGGTVQIESAKGKGSTCTVQLPCEQ